MTKEKLTRGDLPAAHKSQKVKTLELKKEQKKINRHEKEEHQAALKDSRKQRKEELRAKKADKAAKEKHQQTVASTPEPMGSESSSATEVASNTDDVSALASAASGTLLEPQDVSASITTSAASASASSDSIDATATATEEKHQTNEEDRQSLESLTGILIHYISNQQARRNGGITSYVPGLQTLLASGKDSIFQETKEKLEKLEKEFKTKCTADDRYQLIRHIETIAQAAKTQDNPTFDALTSSISTMAFTQFGGSTKPKEATSWIAWKLLRSNIEDPLLKGNMVKSIQTAYLETINVASVANDQQALQGVGRRPSLISQRKGT